MAVPLDMKKITICLEQKILFMTSIYNTTKQIEVKSQQDEIEFQSVLTERANSMSRIDKCDKLISQTIAESDDEQTIIIVKGILDKPSEMQLESVSEEYVDIAKLAIEYVRLLRDTIELDKIATSVAKARYVDVKEKLKKLRNPSKRQNLFKV